MILQALFELAEYEELVPDPNYDLAGVAWLVRIDDGGRLISFEGTHDEDDKRRRPKTFWVPREPARTSGDRANFFVDKAEYVFGIEAETGKPGRKSANRFALYRERIHTCAEASGDEGAKTLALLLDKIASGEVEITLPEETKSNDLFGFVHGNENRLIVERPAVRDYWRHERTAAHDPKDARPCLITGEIAQPARLHPQVKPVPGASSSGVPLVSFNAGPFESYGWSGNDNAPVSERAAILYSVALQRLIAYAPPNPNDLELTLPRRNLHPGGDTVLCYWAPATSAFVDSFGGLIEARPEEVGEAFRSIWKGRAPALDEDEALRFYGLLLQGAQGRIVVRDWLETTVGRLTRNLIRHFADIDVVRNTPKPKKSELPPTFGLYTLLESLAVQGKRDNVPPPLVEQLLRAIIDGREYPLSILQRALLRYRAEIGRDGWVDSLRRDARVALIKGVLIRRFDKEIKPAMDPDNTNPGYRLGRLMAVLERLQTHALGDINATIVDRFFGAASATPSAVFPRLLKNARHHVSKAKDTEAKRSTAFWLDRQIDEILAGFDLDRATTPIHQNPALAARAFPSFLSVDDQGMFVLGYHQQRHSFFQKRSTEESGDSP
ncbi:MAG: type I-C CRISPR-associated protein Cas8c/Csd1 [Acidobacteriota bacterium]